MNHSERRNRQPLYVPVATQPELEDCWSVNLSTEGIGLTCADARSLAEGDELVIEFALPDAGSTVRARGSVQWLALEPESGRPTLGVLFSRLSGENRMRLSTYLADYRFHVAVVAAPGANLQR
ncbi:MAG: PilZ domain-containing protein, partial [Myxococcota bacterium]